MTAWLRTLLVVFRTHVTRTVVSRRFLIMVGLALVPAAPVLASVARGSQYTDVWLRHSVWFLHLQVIAPLVALIGATAAISEEVQDGTIVWMLVRPVSRPAFFIGRWLAILVPVLLAGTIGVIALAVILVTSGRAPGDLFGPIVQTTLLALVTYAAVFAALGACFRRPVIAGLVYAFGMEGLLANLPGTSPEASIVHLARSMLMSMGSGWSEIGSEGGMTYPSGESAVATLVWVVAIALVCGCVGTRHRQYAAFTG